MLYLEWLRHHRTLTTLSMASAESVAINKRAAEIFVARQITQDDRTFLMSVFAHSKIDDASEALIDKIYAALASGKIRVVD